jgi:glycosyltransferase involved in cell wall biosynthesis
VRDALGIGPTGLIVGHFGTYAPAVCRLLEGPLTAWLRALPHALGLLLGQGGDTLAAELHQLYPDLAGRFLALGPQSAAALAAHLAACDLLIQPYPDGACGRRGSPMAGLALGRAILTTRGRFTEPIWEASGAVALADENATALQAVGAALLADPARRRLLGERAAALYERAFRLECTVARLLS